MRRVRQNTFHTYLAGRHGHALTFSSAVGIQYMVTALDEAEKV